MARVDGRFHACCRCVTCKNSQYASHGPDRVRSRGTRTALVMADRTQPTERRHRLSSINPRAKAESVR